MARAVADVAASDLPPALPPPPGMSSEPGRVTVLEDPSLVADLRKRRSGLRAAFRASVTVILFSAFLACFTGLMLSEPYRDYAALEHSVQERFDKNAAVPLANVHSITTFWDYMHRTIMPGLYGNSTPTWEMMGDGGPPKLLPLDNFNLLLGAMRLRTVRIQKNKDCGVSETFQRFFDKCYGEYSDDAEDRAMYGPPIAPFKWSADNIGNGHSGQLASYPAGGFMEVLTVNKTRSEELLVRLKTPKESWVDAATRAIFIDFTVWNGNNGLYAVCRITFELAPTGNWVNSFDSQVLSQRYITPFGFGKFEEWMMMIGEMCICLFVLYYIAEEISEACILKLEYLDDGWNAVDLTNLVLLIVVLAIRIMTYSAAADINVGGNDWTDPMYFTNFQGVAANVKLVREINAFNAVLIWLKTVKYIDFIPYVTTLIWTIRMSWQMLVSFSCLFLPAFTGFVIAYNVGFGDRFSFLSNFWKALIFLSRSFLNDANMTVVYESSPLLGSLLILLFVLGVKFIILNLFYAILINAFADAKAKWDGGKMEQWSKFLEKVDTIKETVWKAANVEGFVKKHCRGLHARRMRKRKFREQKEKLREERWDNKEKQKKQLASVSVEDSSAPPAGRVTKKKVPENEDSSDSEVDLGPLNEGYNKRQLRVLEDGGKGDGQHAELVMKGVQHMAKGLADRTNWLRKLVLEEMRETRMILMGVSDVLEVLNRRSKHLEADQMAFLSG
jgi:hypothetical protein